MPKKSKVELINEEWKGLAGQISPVTQTLDHFQVDQGGNHETEGLWAVRRGAEHTGFSKRAAGITAISSFETQNGSIAYVSVAGAVVYGETE